MPNLYPSAFFAQDPEGNFVPISINDANAMLTAAGSGPTPASGIPAPQGMYATAVYAQKPNGDFVPVQVDVTGALIISGSGGGGGGATFPGTLGLVKNTSTTASTTAVAGTDYVVPGGSGAGLTGITAAQVGAATSASAANASNLTSGRVGVPNYVAPFLTYTAFGDSITWGAEALSQNNSYPSIIGRHIGVLPNNLGVPGATSNATDPIIFANKAKLPTDSTGLVTYQIGTNNITASNSDVNQAANYGNNILAQAAFLSIPAPRIVLATSFAQSGAWTAGQFAPSRKSSTTGNTVTFTATGSVIYIATVLQIVVANGGTATFTVDGVANGATLNFSGAGGVNVTSGYQTALTRISGLSNTAHTVVITVTSATGVVELAWAAGLVGTAQANYPIFMFGSVIPRNPDTATNAAEILYRSYITAAVATLSGDGLSAQYVDNSGVLTAATINDGIHPNDPGYYALAQPYIVSIDTYLAYSIALAIEAYKGAVVASNATGGSNNLRIGGSTTTAFSAMTGSNNTFVGYDSGRSSTTAFSNVFIGGPAGLLCATGSGNVGIGHQALNVGTAVSNNTAIGWTALQSSTGASNTAVGYRAGVTATGANATTVSTNMTFVGASSGASTPSATVLTNSTAIGDSALVGVSNMVQLGNAAVLTLGVGAVTWSHGAGVPSGSAATGSLYTNTTGGAGTTLYVYEGSAWVAK